LTAVEGIECTLPRGGMFVFPSVAALLRDNSVDLRSSSELAAWLLDEAHIAVVPGEAFQAPGHLRVNFTVDNHALDEAAGRLHTALRSLTSLSELNSRLDARAGGRAAVPQ
jgi:aspartate aminotransferase